MRINARLSTDEAGYLNFLMKSTKMSVSEIVKEAIKHFYFKSTAKGLKPLEIYKELGFIGSISEDRNFSTDYKKHLSESLSKKHVEIKK